MCVCVCIKQLEIKAQSMQCTDVTPNSPLDPCIYFAFKLRTLLSVVFNTQSMLFMFVDVEEQGSLHFTCSIH